MSGEVFDQNRTVSSQEKHKQVESANSSSLGPRGQKIGKSIIVIVSILIIGYYIFDSYFHRTIDCTVISAQATSGGGGLRAASSSQGVDVETEECGLLVFVRMQNEGFDSARDLADELNRHRGETLTFRVSYLRWGHYTTHAVELEGFPIRG